MYGYEVLDAQQEYRANDPRAATQAYVVEFSPNFGYSQQNLAKSGEN
jgi:hypothetical protein